MTFVKKLAVLNLKGVANLLLNGQTTNGVVYWYPNQGMSAMGIYPLIEAE
jgi:hypothetical protein